MRQAMKSVKFALPSRSNLFIGKVLFAARYAEDLSRLILLLLPLGHCNTNMAKPDLQSLVLLCFLHDIASFIHRVNPSVHISVEEFSRFYLM